MATIVIHSVHDVLSTRLCAARDCANDAENGWALCTSCERRRARGIPIPLHVTPERLPDTLYCCKCKQDKPDKQFPLLDEARQPGGGGRGANRRGRYFHCHTCVRRIRDRAKAKANALLEGR